MELELSHAPLGPWYRISPLQALPQQHPEPQTFEGRFFGAARYWRWSITSRKSSTLAFTAVSFCIKAGEIALDMCAPKRMEISATTTGVNRLSRLVSSMMAHDEAQSSKVSVCSAFSI
jgi:hypothetical protein